MDANIVQRDVMGFAKLVREVQEFIGPDKGHGKAYGRWQRAMHDEPDLVTAVLAACEIGGVDALLKACPQLDKASIVLWKRAFDTKLAAKPAAPPTTTLVQPVETPPTQVFVQASPADALRPDDRHGMVAAEVATDAEWAPPEGSIALGEVSRLYGIHRDKIGRWVRLGLLERIEGPAYKTGKPRVYFPLKQIETLAGAPKSVSAEEPKKESKKRRHPADTAVLPEGAVSRPVAQAIIGGGPTLIDFYISKGDLRRFETKNDRGETVSYFMRDAAEAIAERRKNPPPRKPPPSRPKNALVVSPTPVQTPPPVPVPAVFADPEIAAMAEVVRGMAIVEAAISPLEPHVRERVGRWAQSRWERLG